MNRPTEYNFHIHGYFLYIHGSLYRASASRIIWLDVASSDGKQYGVITVCLVA